MKLSQVRNYSYWLTIATEQNNRTILNAAANNELSSTSGLGAISQSILISISRI